MPAKPTIKVRALADLRPDPENARTHSPEQIAQVAASIRRFGWTMPILADELIRAGHGRAEAARLIYDAGERIYMAPGRERGGAVLPDGTVPTIDSTGWTAEERTAYSIADNRLPMLAGWDEDKLREQLVGLEALDFDVDLTGFSYGDVTMLVAGAGDAVDALAEWKGMPEFDQQDKRPFRSIPVHFGSQEDVDRFAALIGQAISPATRFVWYPEIVIERYADKQYVDERA